jgi:hypothetical protein
MGCADENRTGSSRYEARAGVAAPLGDSLPGLARFGWALRAISILAHIDYAIVNDQNTSHRYLTVTASRDDSYPAGAVIIWLACDPVVMKTTLKMIQSCNGS